jgi:hypothetical protein
MLGKFDQVWEGNENIYHWDDTNTVHLNTKVPNVGVVKHI